ncbi:hypothetical protein GEMRC1_005207 [Eukaryota sp. GEM-RC1]
MGISSSVPIQRTTEQPIQRTTEHPIQPTTDQSLDILAQLRHFLFHDNADCASEVLQTSDDSIAEICDNWDLDDVEEIVKGFNLFKDHPETKVVTVTEPPVNDSSLCTSEEVAFWIGVKHFLSQQPFGLNIIFHSPLLLFEPNSNRICTPFKGELLREVKPLSDLRPMSFAFIPIDKDTDFDHSNSKSLSDLMLASFTTTVFKILSHPDNSFLIKTPCHPYYHIDEDELNPTSITKKLSWALLFLLVKTTTSSSFPFVSALSNPSKFPVYFLSVFQTVFSTYCDPTLSRPLKRLKVSRDMLDFDPNQTINWDLIDEMVVESLKDLSLIDALLSDSSKSTLINLLMPKLFNITVFSINSSNCSDSLLIKRFTDNFLPLTDSFVCIQAESYVKTVDYVHVVTSKFVISLETSFDRHLFSPLRDILISKDLVKVFKGIDCELMDLLHFHCLNADDIENFIDFDSILTGAETETLSKKSDSDDLFRKYLLIKDKTFSEVKRIPCKSVLNFTDDHATVNYPRKALLSFLGESEAYMIPSHILLDTKHQYKSPLGVTVCPILDEFPKVEGVIIRFDLPLEVLTPRLH